MKILVTGAAGFTGLFFKSAAEAAGHQVLGLQADLTGADQSVALTVQHALDVHGEDAFAFTERRARDSQRLARIKVMRQRIAHDLDRHRQGSQT